MGHSWSSRAPKLHDGGARIEITEKDALTVCEDGDLLLVREQVAHTALRVVLDAHVARDIARMQHSQFPTQRITQLPGSTLESVTHGRLHVLEITIDGLALIPFSDKVASRLMRRDRVKLLGFPCAYVGCRPVFKSANVMSVHACAALCAKFAIRRLKSHVASDVFRTLVAEITALGASSLEWRSFEQRDLPMALTHDHASIQLPPCITSLMKRTLSLFQNSVTLVETTSKGSATTVTSQAHHALQQQPDHSDSPAAPKANAKPPGSISSMDRPAAIDQANAQMWRRLDEHEILSACFVAVVYERVGIMAPIQQTRVEHRAITPTCFWARPAVNSDSGDAAASELLPNDTLEHDMFLL